MAFKVAAVNARTGQDQQAMGHDYVAAAAAAGCALVCFPEGFLCRAPRGHAVFCNTDDFRVQCLIREAREHRIAILAGMWEQTGQHRHLSALYISPLGESAVIHRKLVLARRERWLDIDPGSDLRVYHTPLCTIGASLCLENWMPEIPRALALAGAELLYAPSYLGLAVARRFDYYDMWKQLLRVRAAENCCYVVACTNAIAQRPLALVADPDGTILAERELPGMITAVVDPEQVRRRRAGCERSTHVPPLRIRPFTLGSAVPCEPSDAGE